MKIVSFADKPGSAIDRLCKMNQKRFSHLNYKHLTLHPKRPSEQEIEAAHEALRDADVIDFSYWKTAVMVRKLFPQVEGKKMILTHQNEHNINDDEKNHWEWKDMRWDAHVAKNGWQNAELRKQGYESKFIRHAIEFDSFAFTPKLTKEKIVGYVGQIKKVKGVREIKKACDELGYKLMIVGKPSEASYWAEMDKEGIIHYQDVPDDKIGQIYSQMRVYICNSDDGTESGTMPILEAMLSGIPVITRKIGLVRDCGEHMKNMYIRNGKYTDIQELKDALMMIVENEDVSNNLRENAWRSVRQYHPDVQAREYNILYHRVMYPGKDIVSVIIPTFNRADVLTLQFEALDKQTYRNFEVIIADDGSTDTTKEIVESARKNYSYPIKYVNTGDPESYGLAKARNMALIEAIGDIVVLCDDRLMMNDMAIENFVSRLNEETSNKKLWLWGSKGVFKQFVENFSATWRRGLIDGGMFNERIDKYGGMTQEVNQRFNRQGYSFEWCPEALAEPVVTTHSKSKHRKEIIESKVKLYKMGFQ